MRGYGLRFRVVGILALASLVAVAASCASDDSGDGATTTAPVETVATTDEATTTTEPETTTKKESATTTQPSTTGTMSWKLEQSLAGELDQVVAWSQGFAAIKDAHDSEGLPGVGEIWYSVDGVQWAPGAEVSSGPDDDVFKLVGHQGDLFALSGDWATETAVKTLWHRRADEPWEMVVADRRLELLAVGDHRMIAYGQNGFEVVGVFDTTTSAAVEYEGLPEVEFATVDGDAAADEFEPVLYQGRAIALDDGFLADVSWLVGPNDVEGRLFVSEDASTWIEHPGPPAGPLVLQYGESSAPIYKGVNLLHAGGVVPARSWLTDDGIEFETTRVPRNGIVVGTTIGFVAVDPFGAIHRSTDGSTWVSMEAPPTWGEHSELEEPGFVRGTVVDANDQLLAISVHAEIEGFGTLIDPTTEIWSVRIDDVIADGQ